MNDLSIPPIELPEGPWSVAQYEKPREVRR